MNGSRGMVFYGWKHLRIWSCPSETLFYNLRLLIIEKNYRVWLTKLYALVVVVDHEWKSLLMIMKLLLMIMNEKVFCWWWSCWKCQHCQTMLHTNKVEIVTDIVVMSDEVVSDKSVDGWWWWWRGHRGSEDNLVVISEK